MNKRIATFKFTRKTTIEEVQRYMNKLKGDNKNGFKETTIQG